MLFDKSIFKMNLGKFAVRIFEKKVFTMFSFTAAHIKMNMLGIFQEFATILQYC